MYYYNSDYYEPKIGIKAKLHSARCKVVKCTKLRHNVVTLTMLQLILQFIIATIFQKLYIHNRFHIRMY